MAYYRTYQQSDWWLLDQQDPDSSHHLPLTPCLWWAADNTASEPACYHDHQSHGNCCHDHHSRLRGKARSVFSVSNIQNAEQWGSNKGFFNPASRHYFSSIPPSRRSTFARVAVSLINVRNVWFSVFRPESRRQFQNYPASSLSKWVNPAPAEIFWSRIPPSKFLSSRITPSFLFSSRSSPNQMSPNVGPSNFQVRLM